jgi:hypothetical protein
MRDLVELQADLFMVDLGSLSLIVKDCICFDRTLTDVAIKWQ